MSKIDLKDIDLKAVGEQLKADAREEGRLEGYRVGYEAGFIAGVDAVANSAKNQRSEGVRHIPTKPPKGSGGKSYTPEYDTLIYYVFELIKNAEDGLTSLQIKNGIKQGRSKFAPQPDIGKRIDTALMRLRDRKLIRKAEDRWQKV